MASGALAASMFDGAANSAIANGGRGQAPALSPYYQLQKASSFRSSATFSRTLLDLETGFANHGVQWRMAGAARYECDAFVHGAKLEFAVACFTDRATGASRAEQIVVDMVPLSGCRAAFSSFYASFVADLAYAERRPGEKRRRFAALMLPASATTTVAGAVVADATREEAKRLCSMYSDGGMQTSAARAVAAMAAQPESAELFFGPTAAAAAAAAEPTPSPSSVTPTPLADAVAHAAVRDDACALLACSAIANLAVNLAASASASASACATTDAALRDFLGAQIPGLKQQLEDSECAHTRRECLRALAAITKDNSSLRAAIVRAGMMDLLELEAQAGVEEGRECEDVMARTFAHTALVGCRG